ncbi:hypothetical protein GCM10027591_02670 [Zhihengliuella somnathii]
MVRGWTEEPRAPAEPTEETVTVTGRLLPTETPQANDASDGVVGSLSVAQLINEWDVDSYSAFVVAFEAQTPDGSDAMATDLEPVWVGPQPPGSQTNWLNIFYGLEWAVFAGFAFFLWTRLVADDYKRTQKGKTVSKPQARRLGGTHAQIQNAATWFKIAAYVTGVFLLLLVVEMVAKYGFGVELYAGGMSGDGQPHVFGFLPSDSNIDGFNVTLAIQIAHGWMYVLYLLCDFRLWMLMRWKFTRFLYIALGGVVPFLSFYVESKIHREVERDVEDAPAAAKRY